MRISKLHASLSYRVGVLVDWWTPELNTSSTSYSRYMGWENIAISKTELRSSISEHWTKYLFVRNYKRNGKPSILITIAYIKLSGGGEGRGEEEVSTVRQTGALQPSLNNQFLDFSRGIWLGWEGVLYQLKCEKITVPFDISTLGTHPHSLSVFIVCMKKFCILSYPKCTQWRFWSDCVNVQSDLNSLDTHQKALFLTLRLMFFFSCLYKQ